MKQAEEIPPAIRRVDSERQPNGKREDEEDRRVWWSAESNGKLESERRTGKKTRTHSWLGVKSIPRVHRARCQPHLNGKLRAFERRLTENWEQANITSNIHIGSTVVRCAYFLWSTFNGRRRICHSLSWQQIRWIAAMESQFPRKWLERKSRQKRQPRIWVGFTKFVGFEVHFFGSLCGSAEKHVSFANISSAHCNGIALGTHTHTMAWQQWKN